MSMQDPIANALTIVRNAILVKKEKVIIPYSKIVEKIFEKMLQEKFIASFNIINKSFKTDIKNKDKKASVKTKKNKYRPKQILVKLWYVNNQSVITNLKRISKPSARIYVNSNEIPRVLNNLGLAIISTSQGILTDKEARKEKVGGEVIAYIW